MNIFPIADDISAKSVHLKKNKWIRDSNIIPFFTGADIIQHTVLFFTENMLM